MPTPIGAGTNTGDIAYWNGTSWVVIGTNVSWDSVNLWIKAANLALPNNGKLYAFDSGGTARSMFYIDGSNNQHLSTSGIGSLLMDASTFNVQDKDVTGLGSINSTPIPKTDNNNDLGAATKRWRSIYLKGSPGIAQLAGIATVGFGVPAIFGLDNRKGLTSTDGAATTLYTTTTAAGQLYRLAGRILATTLGAGGAATYTLKWTEGSAVITKTLTVSAVDSDTDFEALIQPDNSTNITAQLTAISGAATAVNVAATVEELA